MAEGRGRLSSIDLLPEDAEADLAWAMGELNARKRTQSDILAELNGRLADKGLPLISKSAFNRRSIRIAAAAKKIAERRALFEGIAPQFTPDKIAEADIVIGELIKTLITELLDREANEFDPKGAMELSRAYKHTIEGQRLSGDAKRRALAEFDKKVGAAVDAVSKTAGITADARRQIMEQLGVVQKGA